MLCLCSLAPVTLAVTLTDARLWRAPDHTRIVFDLDSEVEHKVLTLNNPDRLVIDLGNTRLKANLRSVELKDSPVIRIRSGVHNEADLRVVLDLKGSVKPRSFILKANERYGDRLVVDLYDRIQSKKPTVKKAQNVEQALRDVIVAIDAGHGGEDPGALGPKRVREKHIVLAVAKELDQRLRKTQGYRPVLIRRDDYYIGLKKRRMLARENNEDLFICIHADAFKDPKVSGSSVYALSQRGASSATARLLAEKENLADLVGGVSLQNKDELLSEVLLDLSMTYKLAASMDFGAHVLRSIEKVSPLHTRRVDQAAFAVLKTPDIPSILVEIGFVSNPREARRLSNKDHQKRLARALHEGITGYFVQYPPDGSRLAWNIKHQPKEYTISRGDTLSDIAQRHRVTVASLRKENGLNSNAIRVGQKIIIPAS